MPFREGNSRKSALFHWRALTLSTVSGAAVGLGAPEIVPRRDLPGCARRSRGQRAARPAHGRSNASARRAAERPRATNSFQRRPSVRTRLHCDGLGIGAFRPDGRGTDGRRTIGARDSAPFSRAPAGAATSTRGSPPPRASRKPRRNASPPPGQCGTRREVAKAAPTLYDGAAKAGKDECRSGASASAESVRPLWKS